MKEYISAVQWACALALSGSLISGAPAAYARDYNTYCAARGTCVDCTIPNHKPGTCLTGDVGKKGLSMGSTHSHLIHCSCAKCSPSDSWSAGHDGGKDVSCIRTISNDYARWECTNWTHTGKPNTWVSDVYCTQAAN